MQTPLAAQLRQFPTPIATAGLGIACPCKRGRHPNGVGSGEWKTMPLNDIFRFVAREMRGDVLKADKFTFVVYYAGMVDTATAVRVPNVLLAFKSLPLTLDLDALRDPPELDLGAGMASAWRGTASTMPKSLETHSIRHVEKDVLSNWWIF